MNAKLPKVAESLIKASNEQNVKAYVACFTEDSSIDDVGEIISGKTAIENWFTGKDYEYQMEPTDVKESSNTIMLKTKVTGTFDGSPINFKLEILLASGLIHHLKMDVDQ